MPAEHQHRGGKLNISIVMAYLAGISHDYLAYKPNKATFINPASYLSLVNARYKAHRLLSMVLASLLKEALRLHS